MYDPMSMSVPQLIRYKRMSWLSESQLSAQRLSFTFHKINVRLTESVCNVDRGESTTGPWQLHA